MIPLFADILFPSRCAGCGRPVSSQMNFLCGACARAIPLLDKIVPGLLRA